MRTRPFAVHVGKILKTREPRRERLTGEIPDLFVSASEVPPGGEVTVDVVLGPIGNTIEAVGAVEAPWVGQCRRCLQPASGTLTAQVRELFEPEPEEGESYPLDHDQIDLEAMAREAVVLELPPAPLCREDCRGLCAQCGAELNEGPCSCEAPVDPRWAALDQLRQEPDADD